MSSSIKQTIDEAMKDACAHSKSSALARFALLPPLLRQREVDERIAITDDIALQILDKMVKQRRDSIQQFQAANVKIW